MEKIIKNGKIFALLLVMITMVVGCSRTNYNPANRVGSKGKRHKTAMSSSAPKKTKVRKKWVIQDSRRSALGAQKYAKRPKR